MEETTIEIKESYGDNCLNDSVYNNDLDKRRPRGEVKIFDDDGKLIDKENLVLYQGRSLLMQALLNTNSDDIVGNKDMRLYWFGVGDGGCDVSDPFNPSSPVSSDTDLYNEIPISETDTSCGDLRGDGSYYKYPANNFEFEQDDANDGSFLITKITIQLGAEHANDQQISEAGLFFADSGSAGYSPGADEFHLYARVTFPTILKTADRRLTFKWYLYF